MHPDDVAEAKRLRDQGVSLRAIARKLGCNIKTIRKLLGRPAQPPAPSKIEPFLPKIKHLVEMDLTVPRILREIRALGYAGGRTLLADRVRSLRGPHKTSRILFRRFETPSGAEGQADWSPYRIRLAGREVLVHCFALILAWSRALFIAFYRDEKLPTLLHAHTEAFAYFDGLPRTIVYDNMATVTLGRAGGSVLWHPAFLEFARHYGYTPRVCRPRHPNRKGKIERPFSFIDSDLLRGCAFDSWDDLNRKARQWLDTVANRRLHATTRRVPAEALRDEHDALIRLPDSPYPTGRREVRKVSTDGFVSLDGSFYPVPAAFVGQFVSVRVFPHRVEILDGSGAPVVAHRVPDVPTRILPPADFSPVRNNPVTRGDQETRFLSRFPAAAPFLEGLILRMKGLASVHLKRLECLVELYGEAVVAAAVDRAGLYRNFSAYAVERILQRDHPDVIPVPPLTPLTGGPATLGTLDSIDSGTLSDSAYDFESRPPVGEPIPDDKPF
jgi:transposase